MRASNVVIPVLSLITLACGAPAKAGFSESNAGDTHDGGSGHIDGDSGLGNPSFGDGAATMGSGNNGSYDPPTQLGCSSRAQDILIIDFRSGWWAGGGGADFASIGLGAVVGACAKTSVDYHHVETQMHVKCVYETAGASTCTTLTPAVTVQDIEASFEKPSVADYTQIWVLSGSDQDPSDVPVGDALFQGIMADTRGACIPMLIAAGDGFVTHANTITQDVGMGTVFTAKTAPPGFFMYVEGIRAMSSIQAPGLTSHLLFTGVPSVADEVASFVQQSRGDGLVASVPGQAIYDVIARDGAGNPTIAVGAAKLAGDSYRPFVFDSGWQRMYVLGNDAGTTKYLQNIVMYLGLVGCKAAPIGTPQ